MLCAAALYVLMPFSAADCFSGVQLEFGDIVKDAHERTVLLGKMIKHFSTGVDTPNLYGTSATFQNGIVC